MGQGLQRAFAAAERTRPLTAKQARMLSMMPVELWHTAEQLYQLTGQTGLTENAAKHANPLHRRGLLEKRNMGEPQWMRPARNPA